MSRLIIVAWTKRSLYDLVREAYANQDDVQVILDRRLRHRRLATGRSGKRRRSERRIRPQVDEQVRDVGWAEVPL
ncbi:MAG: hypothetical protein ACREJG_12065 [Candidatus Rokuibacteriota bacterium]